MNKEKYYLGAYWGARAESRHEVAERLSATMLRLRSYHELLARWNEQADTFEEALRLVVEPRPEALVPLFDTTEPDDPGIFGWSVMLWNGREHEYQRCLMNLASGAVPEWSYTTNRFVLSLTADPEREPTLFEPALMRRLLATVAGIWQPDYAFVMSHAYENQYVLPDGAVLTMGKPRVGWMTYLRSQRLGELPAHVPFPTADVDDLGTIFTVTEEHRFSAENPDDVAQALALTDFLEKHRALEVIPTELPA